MATVTFVDLVAEGETLQVCLPRGAPFICKLGHLWLFHGTLSKTRRGVPTLFAETGELLAAGPSHDARARSAAAIVERYAEAGMLSTLSTMYGRALEARGFRRIETPMVVSRFDGGLSRPAAVRFGGADIGYVRSNFEAPLQAHLADGFPRVFQIGGVHRNGREYPLVEAYATFQSLGAGVELVISLLAEVGEKAHPRSTRDREPFLDALCRRDWEFVDAIEALADDLGLDPADINENAGRTSALLEGEVNDGVARNPEGLLRRYLKTAGARRQRATVFHNLPRWYSPLYQFADGDATAGLLQAVGVLPGVGTVFDAGVQENDPESLAERIAAQRKTLREGAGSPSPAVNSPLIETLTLGVPPSFGFGTAVRRLLFPEPANT